MNTFGLTPAELRRLRALKSPHLVQRFLEDLPYHHANTAWSPRRVLREETAHCLEGAVFAAAALRVNGFKPLLWDLEAVRDTDHVLAIYQYDGHWGSIAKSNFAGLRFREPVYRSLRELAMSYFDNYYNLLGERTLRAFSRPVDLSRFDRLNWMTTDQPVWFIAEHLCHVKHTPLITPLQEKRLTRLDRRAHAAGLTGYTKH
ncbi:MAG TPA: hypothetical protein VN577_00270 [Terriglobales bacterium]|nr:hypothetical protein [Terriglobales bacterium]